MKKLQNNFTTMEQSKRLLELGVPADSADFYWIFKDSVVPTIVNEGTVFSAWEKTHKLICHDTDMIPCWSVGRLIEIYNITCDRFPGMGLQLGFIPSGLQTFTEYIIKKIEYAKEDSLAYFEALNVED